MEKISNQLAIIHLSDIHFGNNHRFNPDINPAGDLANANGIPSLIDSLLEDISSMEASDSDLKNSKIVFAITGDLSFKGAAQEFNKANDFLDKLLKVRKISKRDIFVIPGNHDVIYNEPDESTRWQPYVTFYNNFFEGIIQKNVYTNKLHELNRVVDLSDTLGAVILELNSCQHVAKGSADEKRGQIDHRSLRHIEEELEKIPKEKLDKSIKIALIHHHPILIPVFAEPSVGYDAIINSSHLLNILRKYQFQLILHGHKHYTQVFTYDTSCAWIADDENPIMLISGGSLGSTSLPINNANSTNTYNIIKSKWNWKAKEARVEIITRGLSTRDKNGELLPPYRWTWSPLKTLNRILKYNIQHQSKISNNRPFNIEEQAEFEKERKAVYQDLRLNMPIVQVVPSLHPGQEYEAHVSIVPHKLHKNETPTEVTWMCGENFDVCSCSYDKNKNFEVVFAFYGPMLIQAQMKFKDGKVARGYVYAHMPNHFD